MALNLTDGIYAALISGVTLMIRESIAFLRKQKKVVQETEKISAETKVLISSEQREKARFCEEQLLALEQRYNEQQEENNKLREMLKVLTIQLDELQKKTNETLNNITFLKLELEAYK